MRLGYLQVMLMLIILGGLLIIFWGGSRVEVRCIRCRQFEIIIGIGQVLLGVISLVGLSRLGRQSTSNSFR